MHAADQVEVGKQARVAVDDVFAVWCHHQWTDIDQTGSLRGHGRRAEGRSRPRGEVHPGELRRYAAERADEDALAIAGEAHRDVVAAQCRRWQWRAGTVDGVKEERAVLHAAEDARPV